MKNKDIKYWEQRATDLELDVNKRAKKANKDINKINKMLRHTMDRKLLYWWNRFNLNNNTIDNLGLLNSEELEEFKYDVWEYTELAKSLGVNDNVNLKKVINASSKHHITKQEAFQRQYKNIIDLFLAVEEKIVIDTLLTTYKESYYKTTYNFGKYLDFEVNLFKPNERKIRKLLSTAWTEDGRNFSERIWGTRRDKLIRELEEELHRSLVKGDNASKGAYRLSKKFEDVNVNNAKALLQTESAYISESAKAEGFKDNGAEEYIIVATLDSKTSPKCQEEDGKVYKVKDRKVGVNTPPFHVYCRSTTAPYFDYLRGKMQRVARADGKRIYVPDNMTYKEFKKKYIEEE